jgi:hypothetical protein
VSFGQLCGNRIIFTQPTAGVIYLFKIFGDKFTVFSYINIFFKTKGKRTG